MASANREHQSGDAAVKKGMIFDIKKYAIDDGPGIRTTIFLKGCPLRCWWCHNPEGQLSEPELMYRKARCNGCWECEESCRKKAISRVADQISVHRNYCNLCGECSKRCPTEALMIVGKEMSLFEVVKEIDKDLIFYDESDGGVTFSGGEPLFQIDFLNALLEECKDKGIRTALDTSGYATHDAINKISDKVDLFLYDIKMMDDTKHRKYTGVSNKLVLENLKELAKNGSHVLVRLAIIPGINDSEDNVLKTAEFMLSYGIKNLSLLPYHRSGIEKYKNLERTYMLKKTEAPSDRYLTSTKKKLEAIGLSVRIGGG